VIEFLPGALIVVALASILLWAGGVIGFFAWSENRAPDATLGRFSGWLQQKPQESAEISGALKHVFDLLYPPPLFSLRGFGRSALISATVWGAFTALGALYFVVEGTAGQVVWRAFLVTHGLVGILVILSNFVSLTIINRILASRIKSPSWALVLSFLVGLVVPVIFSCGLAALTLAGLYFSGLGGQSQETLFGYARVILLIMLFSPYAMAVNSWLIMFPIGVIGYRLVYFLSSKTVGAPWLSGQAERHPLRVLGVTSVVTTLLVLMLMVRQILAP
jgi:hypothetical protein